MPPSVTTGGIPWEKVLPPRLNGSHGYYNWSPSLLIPETESASSAEVGHFFKLELKRAKCLITLQTSIQCHQNNVLPIFKSNLSFN